MKSIKKNDFNKDILLKMQSKEHILVECSNRKETDAVTQTCYNVRDRDPREDISGYTCDRDLENFRVLITAIPREN